MSLGVVIGIFIGANLGLVVYSMFAINKNKR